MDRKIILYVLCLCWSFLSCKEENALTAKVEECGGMLRFEFPQGTNAWDDDIREIQEEFGVYVIYKDIDTSDLNRTWTEGVNNATYYGQESTDEQAKYVVDFLKHHVFAYLTPEITRCVLPMYWYIIYDSYRPDIVYWPDMMVLKYPVQYRFDGLDFWSMCWFYGEFDLDYGGIETPETETEYKKERVEVLYTIFDRAFENGNIQVPEEFYDGFDFQTEVESGSGYELDENFYVMRGFPGVFYGPYGRGFSALNSIDAITLEQNFLEYIHLILWKTKEELEEMWPKDIYTFLWEKRTYVANYVKNVYHVDIEAIAYGPEM